MCTSFYNFLWPLFKYAQEYIYLKDFSVCQVYKHNIQDYTYCMRFSFFNSIAYHYNLNTYPYNLNPLWHSSPQLPLPPPPHGCGQDLKGPSPFLSHPQVGRGGGLPQKPL